MLPVHIDVVINDMGALEHIGVVIVIKMDDVVLLVEADDDAILQAEGVDEHLVRGHALVDGNPLNEALEKLRLGHLSAHLEVLLGLNPKENKGQDECPDARIPPPRPHLVVHVEDAQDHAGNNEDEDECRAHGRIRGTLRDDVIDCVEVHLLLTSPSLNSGYTPILEYGPQREPYRQKPTTTPEVALA